jgi:hypothetical protein
MHYSWPYESDFIAIRYHNTDIVVYRPDGTAQYTNGGWQTSTTKDRISAFMPPSLSVFQRDFMWRLARNRYSDNGYWVFAKNIGDYVDGMRVRLSDGQILDVTNTYGDLRDYAALRPTLETINAE